MGRKKKYDKPGRPTRYEYPRTETIAIAVTPFEKAKIAAHAAAQGGTISQYLHDALVTSAAVMGAADPKERNHNG
jgi:hypothetical protein